MPHIGDVRNPLDDYPFSAEEQVDFTVHHLLFWFYLLNREPGDPERKHLIRMGVQHGTVSEQLATALCWVFRLKEA